MEGKLLTEEHLDHRLETLELRLDNKMEQLRSSFFHWNLLFFVPLWIGVYGAIVAFVLKN